jgi:peptidoglycan L-alanyl-D-glutamate endopeptidase CwlK
MILNDKSIKLLDGVHPDLVSVVHKAASLMNAEKGFVVTEGLRTLKRQEELVKSGASSTLKSRHLTGHAVDLAVTVNGKVRWDWPLYHELADVMKEAAKSLSIKIECGADWKKFPDGPHFQLSWDAYPK